MYTYAVGCHCSSNSVRQPEKPFIETDGEGTENLDRRVECYQQTTAKGQQSTSRLKR